MVEYYHAIFWIWVRYNHYWWTFFFLKQGIFFKVLNIPCQSYPRRLFHLILFIFEWTFQWKGYKDAPKWPIIWECANFQTHTENNGSISINGLLVYKIAQTANKALSQQCKKSPYTTFNNISEVTHFEEDDPRKDLTG